MYFKIKINVWPKARHPDGYNIEGQGETIEFSEEDVLEALRHKSNIPSDNQRHWEIDSISFT